MAMQVKPIRIKIFSASAAGLKMTAIGTNPAAQKYSLDRNALCIATTAPRQIALSNKNSKLDEKCKAIEAISKTGIEIHLMIFAAV
jgi:hypothetical protein